MKYKAAILGYYGFGNLGDELLLTACLDMFTRCGVKRDALVVLSNNPAETSRNFGVDAVNRWKFREVVKALRQRRTLSGHDQREVLRVVLGNREARKISRLPSLGTWPVCRAVKV